MHKVKCLLQISVHLCTAITSLVLLTLVPIIKELVRSSVSSQFFREDTGGDTALGLYFIPYAELGRRQWTLSSADQPILIRFPLLLYHLSLVLFLKGILFRLGDSSSLGGFVHQCRLFFLSSTPFNR